MTDRTAATPSTQVSAIVTCKDRLAHLKQTLPLLMALPLSQVVIVDFDCPQHAGDWVESAFPAAQVVRVANRPIFCAAAARNIGARAATSPWLFFIDADVRVDPSFAASAWPLLEPDAFFLAEPRSWPLYGTMLVHRAAFEAVGGYDETMQGWGGEDIDFANRLEVGGYRSLSFDGALVEPIHHDNELRTRHHAVQDAYLTGFINGLYSTIKLDLAHHGVTLDEPALAKLYARVRNSFMSENPVRSMEFVFRQHYEIDRQVTTTLKYEVGDAEIAPGRGRTPEGG